MSLAALSRHGSVGGGLPLPRASGKSAASVLCTSAQRRSLSPRGPTAVSSPHAAAHALPSPPRLLRRSTGQQQGLVSPPRGSFSSPTAVSSPQSNGSVTLQPRAPRSSSLSPVKARQAAPRSGRGLPSTVVICIEHYASWQGYKTLREAAESQGWLIESDAGLYGGNSLCCVHLHGRSVSIDSLPRFKGHCRRISHFPLTFLVTDKVFLELLMRRMQRVLAEPYGSLRPRTYLKAEEVPQQRRALVLKAARGAQGKGTTVLTSPPGRSLLCGGVVAQEYVDPMLIDNRKFDLRVYCMVACADPLWIYVHREGLVHLCAEAYAPPCGSGSGTRATQHVGNYAINCHHRDFAQPAADGSTGCLRSFASLSALLKDPAKFWRGIDEAVVSTLSAAAPYLSRGARGGSSVGAWPLLCFELLGIDFAVREDEAPLLLEVNHLPGLTQHHEFDGAVKRAVVGDTFRMLDLHSDSVILTNEREILASGKRIGERVRSRLAQLLHERDKRLLPETNYRRVCPVPHAAAPSAEGGGGQRSSGAGCAAVHRARAAEQEAVLAAGRTAFEEDAAAVAAGSPCPLDPRTQQPIPSSPYARWLDQCARELALVRNSYAAEQAAATQQQPGEAEAAR